MRPGRERHYRRPATAASSNPAAQPLRTMRAREPRRPAGEGAERGRPQHLSPGGQTAVAQRDAGREAIKVLDHHAQPDQREPQSLCRTGSRRTRSTASSQALVQKHLVPGTNDYCPPARLVRQPEAHQIRHHPRARRQPAGSCGGTRYDQVGSPCISSTTGPSAIQAYRHARCGPPTTGVAGRVRKVGDTGRKRSSKCAGCTNPRQIGRRPGQSKQGERAERTSGGAAQTPADARRSSRPAG